MSGNFADCELAYTNLKTVVKRLRYRWAGYSQEDMANKEARLHPTQKPLAVMKWCLSFIPKDSIILDPFAGSGSTLLAAKALGFKAIGIEQDERYCKVAAKCLKNLANRYAKHQTHDDQILLNLSGE